MDEIKEEKQTTENSGDGDKPKTKTVIDEANIAAKRMEDATAMAKEERQAAEDSYSKMRLGGVTEAGGMPAVKKELTDEEYAEALQRGEVNPLKEDGIFK